MAEIAELLGVTKQVVSNWRSRKGGFPAPAATLRSGPVWTVEAIEAWAASEHLELKAVETDGTDQVAPTRRAVIAALMNMKGGVGKSTIAANLGWYAAYRRNLRVLFIDLDPQFNLSQYILGVEGYERLLSAERPTISTLFNHGPGQEPVRFSSLIRQVKNWDDGSCLHLVPANLNLAWSMRLALERAHVLRDKLETVRSQYDLILIDCAPTESILSTATYYAADWIVVPVKPEFLSTIGLPLLLQSLSEFRSSHPTEDPPEIAGVLFNDVSDRVEHDRSRRHVREVAEDNDLNVFTNELSHSDSYPTGARQGKPIFMTDNARSVRKNELDAVGMEVLRKIGL